MQNVRAEIMQKVFTKAKSIREAYHLFRNLMFSLKLEFHFLEKKILEFQGEDRKVRKERKIS